jgi:hypothetical protein
MKFHNLELLGVIRHFSDLLKLNPPMIRNVSGLEKKLKLGIRVARTSRFGVDLNYFGL